MRMDEQGVPGAFGRIAARAEHDERWRTALRCAVGAALAFSLALVETPSGSSPFGAAFVAAAGPGWGGAAALLRFSDGREAQFARGSIGCLVDESLRCMYCETLQREDELLVSVEWFCGFFFNCRVSACGGVVYVTDHFADLSFFMADLILDLLDGKALPTDFSHIDTGERSTPT